MGLSCYSALDACTTLTHVFQCPHGLELLPVASPMDTVAPTCFNALMGLSCYYIVASVMEKVKCFNALMGLSCYNIDSYTEHQVLSFNALMGLSCYNPWRNSNNS